MLPQKDHLLRCTEEVISMIRRVVAQQQILTRKFINVRVSPFWHPTEVSPNESWFDSFSVDRPIDRLGF
jgi:hypothetical protein